VPRRVSDTSRPPSRHRRVTRGVQNCEMTTQASIEFSSFSSYSDPMPRAWQRFRDLLTSGGAGNVEDLEGSRSGNRSVCVWRLLASNNRELARSAGLYGTLDEAVAHVHLLRLDSTELTTVSMHGPSAGTHGWFAATRSGLTVMTCGRWYGALGASVEAAHQAVDALRAATVHSDAHRVLSPDRRRSVR
jgi:hypothetical protein